MYDLMVAGYDLTTQQPVHVEDGDPAHWRAKGYGGNRQLICWHCYLGCDAPPGTQVPLVVKGRVGGRRRTHFAHPAGLAPRGGHGIESVWHATAKLLLSRWARQQPGVIAAQTEGYIEGATRRADVLVTFDTGQHVGLEAQASHQTDGMWTERHDDYAEAGVHDVWFWRPGWWIGLVGHRGLPVWQLDVETRTVSTPVARPHEREPAWWYGPEREQHAPHWPPCLRDNTYDFPMPLADCHLTTRGLQPSPALQAHLDAEWERTLEAAAILRQEEYQREARLRTLPEQQRRIQQASPPRCSGFARGGHRYEQQVLPGAPPPAWLVDNPPISDAKAGLRRARAGEPTCPTCGYRVAFLFSSGRHIGC